MWQTEGVNDRVQLARMSQELNRRILERWMREGVTVIDPRNTWVDVDVDLSQDVTLMPGVILQGATTIAPGAVIGPDTTLQDVEVGENATVIRSHGSFAIIGDDSIGRGIVETLRDSRSPAVLMANHGPFTIGKDAQAAVKAAVMVEEVARTVAMAQLLGDPVPVAQGAIDSLYARYQNVYGQH